MVSSKLFFSLFLSTDVTRGFVWDPLIPSRDLNSMLPADT